MNIKIIILLSLFTILLVSSIQSQEFGIRVGGNLNTPHIDNNMDTKSKLGFNVGATSTFRLPFKSWSFDTGLLFSQERFGLRQEYSQGTGVSYYLRTNRLEVPLNIRKEFDFFIVKQFIQVGPYASYILSGRVKDGSDSHKMDFKNNGDHFDVGVNVGIGSYLPFNFQVLANYGFGFTESKIIFGDQIMAIKRRNWSLALTYVF